MWDISQEHIPEKVSRLLCAMSLHKCVKVPKRGPSISRCRVWITDVEGADELTVIYELYFLMIALEKLSNSACGLQEMEPSGTERIVPYADASCLLELPHKFLVCIVIQVINYQVSGNSPPSCVSHLLKRDVGYHFVVHVVCCDCHQVLSSVYFTPQQVPVVIVVVVYPLFLLH